MIKLLPEQAAKLWHFIRFAIAETFVVRESATNDILQNYLVTILTGQRQVWAILDSEKNIIAILITRISSESLTGERVLSMDNLYAFAIVPQGEWDKAFETLVKFAQSNQCKALTANTLNPRIKDLAGMYGFKEVTYLVKEV